MRMNLLSPVSSGRGLARETSYHTSPPTLASNRLNSHPGRFKVHQITIEQIVGGNWTYTWVRSKEHSAPAVWNSTSNSKDNLNRS
ncbi:hypothetical protein TNCT_178971 [Trichonephila clavata]|uniref:Uncharacterized protein n=1 Tax=Trichonephila clavata TaxID=2740835 RepID=A0A8X6H108_TRICU|nr:hypothetical protein TNCT_178971 [Trichonephila clavata]